MKMIHQTSRCSSITNLTITKRFQRSLQRSNSLQRKKSMSLGSSQPQLSNFYTKFVKNNKKKEENSLEKSQISIDEVLFSNIKKVELPLVTTKSRQVKQRESLEYQIVQLKQRNKQLQLKFKIISKSLEDQINKQNKSLNKIKQITHKQRIKQLQGQNQSLRSIIQELKAELKELKCSKLTEDTSNSVIQNLIDFQFHDEIIQLGKKQNYVANNEKKIFTLNDTIKKLTLEMDFLKRRNHSQIVVIKNNYQKELKTIKDKLGEILQQNIQLKKNNLQFLNRHSNFSDNSLSLSSD